MAAEAMDPTAESTVTVKEFKKNFPNGCAFHASIKFPQFQFSGKKFGGYATASASVLNAEKNI